MCDAAGELADCLKFLRLAKRLLDARALRHLCLERPVRIFQLFRALGHQRLLHERRSLELSEDLANFILARPSSQSGSHSSNKGNRLKGAF